MSFARTGEKHENAVCAPFCPCCFSPEGSYTDDTSQEQHTPQQHHHHNAKPPQPGLLNSDPHEFDDEFDDDDPLPVIGHCKALYGFSGEKKPPF